MWPVLPGKPAIEAEVIYVTFPQQGEIFLILFSFSMIVGLKPQSFLLFADGGEVFSWVLLNIENQNLLSWIQYYSVD